MIPKRFNCFAFYTHECVKHFVKLTLHALYSLRSFTQEILPCILECLEVPKIAKVEGAIDDVDFIKLLDRCETWTVLLTIPGRSLARQN